MRARWLDGWFVLLASERAGPISKWAEPHVIPSKRRARDLIWKAERHSQPGTSSVRRFHQTLMPLLTEWRSSERTRGFGGCMTRINNRINGGWEMNVKRGKTFFFYFAIGSTSLKEPKSQLSPLFKCQSSTTGDKDFKSRANCEPR